MTPLEANADPDRPDPDRAPSGSSLQAEPVGGDERPMFPLGSPLLPGAVLPLHIFEPRYRALARRCIDNDEPFGVVMMATRGVMHQRVGCSPRVASGFAFSNGCRTIRTRGPSPPTGLMILRISMHKRAERIRRGCGDCGQWHQRSARSGSRRPNQRQSTIALRSWP